MKLRPRMAILASGFGSSMQPKVLLSDQSEREHPLDVAWLEQLGQSALARVVAVQRNRGVLRALEEIEITFVNDPTIARVHDDFMSLPDPTDVITFHHGEILISIDTAERQAQEYGRSWQHEVALYMVHGLLHLAGYLDKSPEDFECMAAMQERILADCLVFLNDD